MEAFDLPSGSAAALISCPVCSRQPHISFSNSRDAMRGCGLNCKPGNAIAVPLVDQAEIFESAPTLL
jgi:hypothetical protein